jgi:putative ABC transport system permease protein
MSAVALLLRRDRSDLVALGLVTLLIAFTAFLSAAGVRLFERAANDALRREVAAAPAVQRTVHVSDSRALFGPDAEATVADWQAEGEQARQGFPESIRNVLGEGSLGMTSTRLRVSNPPLYPMFMTLRYRDGIGELVDLTDGRWPVSTGARLPPLAEIPVTESGEPGRPVATDHAADEPRRFEIAVQASTSRSLGLTVGSRLSVGIDYRDTLFSTSIIRSAGVTLAPTELEVTGLYRVRDPESDAWLGDTGLTFDDLGTGLDSPVANINGYVPPDGLPGIVASGLPFEYHWRFPINADRLDAGALAETEQALRLLESQSVGTDAGSGATAESGLLPLLERQRSLRAASEAVLGLASSAPLALATGAMIMAAVLVTRRRRPALVLARGRGAAPRLLFVATLTESVAVAAVACLAGLALALALVPGANLQQSLFVVTAVGVVGVVVLMAAAWPPIRQPLAELESDGARPARRADPRRLVVELSVVVAAIVGAYLLRQRGISTAAVAFDPFLAAVPPLIALATGIAAVRLYRPAVGVASWLAGRRRDLVPILGARIVARGAASSLPVLILLLAVAFAAFTSVVSASIDQAQRTASWVAAGADVRLQPARTGGELPTQPDVAAVPGVEATALGFADPRVRAPINTGVGTLTLHAVDAAALADVVAGSPIEPNWPEAFFGAPTDGPVPAIVATRLTGGALNLKSGDTFQMSVLGRPVQFQVVEVRGALPGLTINDAFVVIPFAWLQHTAGRDVEPTVMWVRVPVEGATQISERASAEGLDIRLTSRYDDYAALRDEPLAGAVGKGFLLALGVSVAYAVLTILGALIQSATRRTRDVAILRTLGLNRGQQTRLTMLEHAPPILVALPVGLALGIGVAYAVTPALNLAALAGSQGAIPVRIDWLPLSTVSLALAIVALAAVVLGTWLSRRAAIVNALRLSSD